MGDEGVDGLGRHIDPDQQQLDSAEQDNGDNGGNDRWRCWDDPNTTLIV